MRILEIEDIAILDRIADTQPTKILSCCDLLADLLQKNESAIIVDDCAYLLIAQNLEKEIFYSKLLKVISLITEARDEGFIYLIPSFAQSPFLLQQQASQEIFIDKGVSKCDIGVITHVSDEIVVVRGDFTYEGFALPTTISSVITSGIYSTTKLRQLQQDKYQTPEEIRYKKELQHTKCGLHISLFALALSIASPFWMTEYNNHHAYSAIDPTQFNIIKGKLDSTRVVSQ